MNRDLDDGLLDLMRIARRFISMRCGPFVTPFYQQFRVNRTGCIPSEAIPERVIELVEAERVAATNIGPVQKGAMRCIG